LELGDNSVDDKSPLPQDLAEVLVQTALFATQIVASNLSPDNESGGAEFPLGDATARLRVDAPQSTVNSAAFLKAVQRLASSGQQGDIDEAINAAYLAGLLTSDVWITADKGRGLAEVMEEIRSRSTGGTNSAILTELQVADAKRWFAEIRPTVRSDNDAAKKTRRKLIDVHNLRREPSLSTVKRAVGLFNTSGEQK
jgi:hypothetical protein